MKSALCIFTLFLLHPLFSQAQIITTYAGNGTAGYSGDSGSADSAELAFPIGIAIDAHGNLYIAEEANNRIRKVDAITGIITTIAGNGTAGFTGDGGPAVSAELSWPYSVAVDANGNVYVSEFHNIRKIDTMGFISTFAGTIEPGYSGDGGLATAALLDEPNGVAADRIGNIYIADAYNQRVRKVDTLGVITTVAGNGYDSVGYGGFSGDGGMATDAELSNPAGIAFDNTGNMYIADYNNNRIRKVNTAGIITTAAGDGSTLGPLPSAMGGAAVSTSVPVPPKIAVDNSGDLYFPTPDIVCEVNTSGIINTIAGGGTMYGDGELATLAALVPTDVAVDGAGNLYIADPDFNRVRKISNSSLFIRNISHTANEINIFPNPAQNTLNVTFANNITSLSIANLLGQPVYTQNYNSQQVQINVADLSPGMYLIKINGTEVRKFVKQ